MFRRPVHLRLLSEGEGPLSICPDRRAGVGVRRHDARTGCGRATAMTGRLLRRSLPSDRRAATAVEFALLAPVFLAMLFGIIEGSRFLWIKESLQEVAFSTARCTSVSADCTTSAGRVDYAIARAQTYGQRLTADNVTVTADTTCNSATGMVRVSIAMPFNSPVVGLLPGLPAEVNGLGCYPVLTA
ncbi:TadE family protein [Nostoc sp. 3335mG]|nr:TadE family protein [Nostoc sp. 3335mG]